jgi:hypothetical protein
MCDLAYVNLLREKVRQLQAEEKRIATFGAGSDVRFIPYVTPVQSQSQDVADRAAACEERTSAPGVRHQLPPGIRNLATLSPTSRPPQESTASPPSTAPSPRCLPGAGGLRGRARGRAACPRRCWLVLRANRLHCGRERPWSAARSV